VAEATERRRSDYIHRGEGVRLRSWNLELPSLSMAEFVNGGTSSEEVLSCPDMCKKTDCGSGCERSTLHDTSVERKKNGTGMY